jgi:transposase InsO family protein
VRYQFIENEKADYPLLALCRVMKVSLSAFYAYRRGATYRKTVRQAELDNRVRACFYFHRRRYGTRRIAAELETGRGAVRAAMRRESLQAIAPRKFKPQTTDSNHNARISPNLLKETANAPTASGEVIVGDITYIRLRDGSFCYLAIFQDKFTRRIVGWAISMRMTVQLVIDAFQMARRRALLKRGAIVHSDRGSQYAAIEFRRLLYIYGFRQSMSAKGNCYDNAQAESFFSRFKAELIEDGIFESIEEARTEIFSYIDGYYNRIRKHSGLGYKSPLEFEKELRIKNLERRDSFLC